MASPVEQNYHEEIKKELESAISQKKISARNLLRLAYAYQFSIANHDHDAAESPAKNHHETIENIHTRHPTITYPDLYQLAGVVAVKELQGPEIDFVPGREDSQISPDDSCLPNFKQCPSELRDVFRKVQISEPKHIVALYGGLKLATAGDGENLKFDTYFVNLGDGKKGSRPSDEPLLQDQEFSNFVQRYATDKNEFFKNYKEAHANLSAVRLPSPSTKKRVSHWQNAIATTPRVVGVGVAVAAAVLIFSVFYLINKRRTQHPSQQFQ